LDFINACTDFSNAANTIMRVVYGIAVSPQDDKYISVAEIALDGMARAANPGAFFVDFIPICGCCVIYPASRN